MTHDEIYQVLKGIECMDYRFSVETPDRGYTCIWAHYEEADVSDMREWVPAAELNRKVIQHTRRYVIEDDWNEAKVLSTALLCVKVSLEHRAREHFKYKGERWFDPHAKERD